jgi:hypothetical protein
VNIKINDIFNKANGIIGQPINILNWQYFGITQNRIRKKKKEMELYSKVAMAHSNAGKFFSNLVKMHVILNCTVPH